MRVAVLADVHGNLPALRAVLAEAADAGVDALVVAGDVVGGPLAREVLELLDARPEPEHWISGNSERELVEVFDGAPVPDTPAGRVAEWGARTVGAAWRDRLASWPITLALDGVRYCHGSPRRDDELLTSASPGAVIAAALDGVAEPLVVGGHTHRQFVRALAGVTYANAGSVGLPYEGEPGAFWMVVADGVPEPQRSSYDLPAAMRELEASGFAHWEHGLDRSLLDPVDPDAFAAMLEGLAGR